MAWGVAACSGNLVYMGDYAADADNRPVAVLDIDGVVADVRHRLYLLRLVPADWDAFFRSAREDPTLPEGVAVAQTLAPTHDIVWLTGRPERTRALTAHWLADNDLPAGELRMRPDRDRRSAEIFKLDEIDDLAAGRTIDVIVDDDPAVVARLKEKGVPVLLADWLPYEPALRQAQETDGRT